MICRFAILCGNRQIGLTGVDSIYKFGVAILSKRVPGGPTSIPYVGSSVCRMPLHIAASSRNMAGVRQLLQFGAEVDVRDINGGTPLFAACEAKAHR